MKKLDIAFVVVDKESGQEIDYFTCNGNNNQDVFDAHENAELVARESYELEPWKTFEVKTEII